MKYLTKKWYMAMQCQSVAIGLEESERAAQRSEDYFQELYRQQLDERIERAKLQLNKEYYLGLAEKLTTNGKMPAVRLDGSPLTEGEKSFSMSFANAIAENLRNDEPSPFDPVKVQNDFDMWIESVVEDFRKKLPADIFARVADARMLALGYVDPLILEEIRRFGSENERYVISMMKDCRAEYLENFGGNKPEFYEKMQWHDCEVKSLEIEDKDVVLTFTYGAVCRFKDSEIILGEEEIIGCQWLYDELYPVKEGYEIHVLFYRCGRMDLEDSLVEFTVRCSDVDIEEPEYDLTAFGEIDKA